MQGRAFFNINLEGVNRPKKTLALSLLTPRTAALKFTDIF